MSRLSQRRLNESPRATPLHTSLADVMPTTSPVRAPKTGPPLLPLFDFGIGHQRIVVGDETGRRVQRQVPTFAVSWIPDRDHVRLQFDLGLADHQRLAVNRYGVVQLQDGDIDLAIEVNEFRAKPFQFVLAGVTLVGGWAEDEFQGARHFRNSFQADGLARMNLSVRVGMVVRLYSRHPMMNC